MRRAEIGEYTYGYLPEKLVRLVLESVKKNAWYKRLRTVPKADG